MDGLLTCLDRAALSDALVRRSPTTGGDRITKHVAAIDCSVVEWEAADATAAAS
jgi:hypothetical protein